MNRLRWVAHIDGQRFEQGTLHELLAELARYERDVLGGLIDGCRPFAIEICPVTVPAREHPSASPKLKPGKPE